MQARCGGGCPDPARTRRYAVDDEPIEQRPLTSPASGGQRSILSRRAASLLLAAGLIGGAGAGSFIVTRAASTSTSSSNTSTSTGSGNGAAHAAATPTPSTGASSNENPSHEQGEDSQREADENAGRIGGHAGAFRPNEDPTHEQGESSQRESQENAQASPTPTP